MSEKKFRLEKVGCEREDGYDWAVVECPECGEEVQRRHIEDEHRGRDDVCPECDASIVFERRISVPSINDYGQ